MFNSFLRLSNYLFGVYYVEIQAELRLGEGQAHLCGVARRRGLREAGGAGCLSAPWVLPPGRLPGSQTRHTPTPTYFFSGFPPLYYSKCHHVTQV